MPSDLKTAAPLLSAVWDRLADAAVSDVDRIKCQTLAEQWRETGKIAENHG